LSAAAGFIGRACAPAPPESRLRRMSTLRRVLLLFLLVIILGGVIFLATWDRPPPIQQIEVEIPDSQLPR
jgi:cell division septal protein FtsQ